MIEEITKEYLRRTRRLLKTKPNETKNFIKDKHLGCLPFKILGTILKMEKWKTRKNGTEEKKITEDAQGLISEG